MSTDPLVSVVMPVYNGEKYIESAVRSILDQTLPDFELIIVNDGSTDGTARVVQSLEDDRIRFIDIEHCGITACPNHGLSLARGKYVARMDSDDIAMPDRLEKQVALLESHPEYGIVGSACVLTDGNGRKIRQMPRPATDLGIRWINLLGTPFAHSTVTLRRNLLTDNALSYDEAFASGFEDYDLWSRVLEHTRGANLKEPLVEYRLHEGGVTRRNREAQLRNQTIVSMRNIRAALPGFSITAEQVEGLRQLFLRGRDAVPFSREKRTELIELHLNLLDAFLKNLPGNPEAKHLRRLETLRVCRLMLTSRFKVQCGRIMRGNRSRKE